MTICVKTRYWLFMMSVVTTVFFYACDKEDESDSDFDTDIGQSVDKMINASEGGQVTTGSMTLVIPPNALPKDVVVSFGVTGEEPESVPNDQLDTKLQPFTIDIPVDTIFEPLKILVKSTSGSYDEDFAVAGYNGNSYFPYFYESSGNELSIEIDVLSWGPPDKLFAPIVIFILDQKQTPPSDMLGLKEVTVSNNQIEYNTIPDVNEDSKVLIMIHGWIGSPETWTDFVPKIQSSTIVEYTNYWTYGYNSSYSIDNNGESLANLIEKVSNGAHIDIVAHSMGGLVSRAALENHDAVDNVNSLITLGTPHLGSSLAVTRHIIGLFIATHPTSTVKDWFSYNASSQGYKDLNIGSSFINGLANNPVSKIPYHTIACVNNPAQWWLSYSRMLPGPDDGIVTVKSAKSVSWATSPTNEVFIDTGNAHVVMTKNDELFDQIVAFLVSDDNDDPDIIYGDGVTDIDGNVYQTVIIGNQEWMAENLRTTRDAEGNDITRYCYDDDETNCELYGGLYTWHTVMNGQSSSSSSPSGVQGICPDGWHVPSDAEWTELVNYVVSQGYPNNSNDPNGAGNALKSCRQVGSPLGGQCDTFEHPRWNSDDTHQGFDEFGFSALPGGYRNPYGSFRQLGTVGHWWTSTEDSSSYTRRRFMVRYLGNVLHNFNNKTLGYSLRCVRDH